MMTITQFELMVASHVVAYDYIDDYKKWNYHHSHFKTIKAAANHLPIDDVRRIWNAHVDKTILGFHRDEFYWKGTEQKEAAE